MKSKIIRIVATAIVLPLVIGISVANAFDDDFMKLQQEQFKLQRQLQQQQFRLQQQQSKLDRQLWNQQFKMQQQLRRQESYSSNLNLNTPSPKWYVSSPFSDPMGNVRSQMRTTGFNMNSIRNSSNRDLIKLQAQQFKTQQQLMRQTFKDQQQLSKIMNTSSNYGTQSLLERYNRLVPDPSNEWNSIKLQSDIARGTGLYISTVMFAAGPSLYGGVSTGVKWIREMWQQPAPTALRWTSRGLGTGGIVRNIYLDDDAGFAGGIVSFGFSELGHHILDTLGPSMTVSGTFHVNNIDISPMGSRVETSGVIDIRKTVLYNPDSIPNWGLPDPLKATYAYETKWSLTTRETRGSSNSPSIVGQYLSITNPITSSDYNRYFGAYNATSNYSYGSNNWISQPTFNNSFTGYNNYTMYQPNLNNNLGSYGNNYQIYQPQFNNNFGGYGNSTFYPDTSGRGR
jgi:uncharacterized membrane-anchored protein YhcB (DUF1043 family)